MTDSLKDVLAKVKQQREVDKQKAKPIAKEEEIQEDELIEEEEEAPEMPAIPVKKPIFKPKPLPIQQPQPEIEEVKQEIKQPTNPQITTEKIVEEIEMLHNEGIFRRELLVKLTQINKNLEGLNELIGAIKI